MANAEGMFSIYIYHRSDRTYKTYFIKETERSNANFINHRSGGISQSIHPTSEKAAGWLVTHRMARKPSVK